MSEQRPLSDEALAAHPEWADYDGERFGCGCPKSPLNTYTAPATGWKQCVFHRKLKKRAYAAANAERIAEYHREYQKANRADLTAYMRDYRKSQKPNK